MEEEQQPLHDDVIIHDPDPPITPNVSDDEPIAPAAPFVHTPDTIYWYDGLTETLHKDLVRILPGANQFPFDEPVMVNALEACCASGLLRQVPRADVPYVDEAHEVPEDETV